MWLVLWDEEINRIKSLTALKDFQSEQDMILIQKQLWYRAGPCGGPRHKPCVPHFFVFVCLFVWFLLFVFFQFYFIFKFYIIVLVLPNIKMNPPQVYMCSPSWTLLHPPSLYHPSGSSQCTSPKHPVSCFEPGLATRFIHDILHVSMITENSFHSASMSFPEFQGADSRNC